MVSFAGGFLAVVIVSSLKTGREQRAVTISGKGKSAAAVGMGLVCGGSTVIFLLVLKWLNLLSGIEVASTAIATTVVAFLGTYLGLSIALKKQK
jgi:hypothetical protein